MNKKKLKILDKDYKHKISSVATYSPSIAKILDGNIDLILVGDSLGTTLYDMKNTQKVSLEMMKFHGFAVIKNIKKSVSVIDMPYKSYETKSQALINAKKLIKFSRADLIKLEIDQSKLNILKHLVDNKIRVIAHIGVTPQKFKNFMKIKILGKSKIQEKKLFNLAKACEAMGAKALLLECIVEKTAKLITTSIKIPTIGIGSSKFCDGQILVFDDIINLSNNKFKPKFVKTYFDFNKFTKKIIDKFNIEIKEGKYPSNKYTYK